MKFLNTSIRTGAFFALVLGSAFSPSRVNAAPQPTLNGNLSDFKDLAVDINVGLFAGAAKHSLDNIPNGAVLQFPDGFQDEPIQDVATPTGTNSHSSANVGSFVFIYSPDSDGVITPASEDDSWLGFGINLGNGDGDIGDISACVDDPASPGDDCAVPFDKGFGSPELPPNIMVPFDADGNGDPCVLGVGAGSRWAPQNPVLTFDEAVEAFNIDLFLCADGVEDLAGADMSLAYEQQNQGNTRFNNLFNVTEANLVAFPPVNSTCASITLRGTDNNTAFPDGRGNDDVEIIVNKIDSQVKALFPAEDYLTATRFRLANLGMTLRSDASGDLSNEDSMFALIGTPLPGLEVKKQVKCVGEPDAEFRDDFDTPPGGEVEYIIEVENTGNVDLVVELEDILDGPIEPVLGSMTVTLFRPGDAVVGTNINFANANSQDPKFNPFFFGPQNNQFLLDMQSGTRRCLGVLRGIDVCGENPHAGDRVVIRFRAQVDDTGDFCSSTSEISNSILACGDPDFTQGGPCSSDPNSGNEIYDRPDQIDTPRENAQDADDNVVDGNVLCFESLLLCDKTITVDFGNDGSNELLNRTSVVFDSSNLPVKLTYNFKVINGGDTPITDICVVDSALASAAAAAGIAVGPCDLNQNGTCTGGGNVGAEIANLNAGASTTISCSLVITTEDQFLLFAGQDGGSDSCFENTSSASGTASIDEACGDFSQDVNSAPCSATVCLQQPPRECVPTKAKFDIWNMNEVRFSGTERCIYSWDQEFLSQYTSIGLANHFHRSALQTDKGKARIDGLRSPVVCGDESIPAPFLGVKAQYLGWEGGRVEKAGTTLVGAGSEVGQLLYTLPDEGEEANLPTGGDRIMGRLNGLMGQLRQTPPGDNNLFVASLDPRVDISTKGSLIVYPKIEIKWDAAGSLIQDTFITITNDFSDLGVDVQLYFVNGDLPLEAVMQGDPPVEIERAHLGCNWQDNVIFLSHDQSVYWSSLSGDPFGVSPFTNLDPGNPAGRPDTDPYNVGGRVLRGYLVGWAVEHGTVQEIRWNHLSGTGTIVNYRDSSAWTYNTWNFQALVGDENDNGQLLLPPYGQLDLNGVEYEYAPNVLVFDFYAVGAYLSSGATGVNVIDTDLTLWAALKDLRDQ